MTTYHTSPVTISLIDSHGVECSVTKFRYKHNEKLSHVEIDVIGPADDGEISHLKHVSIKPVMGWTALAYAQFAAGDISDDEWGVESNDKGVMQVLS